MIAFIRCVAEAVVQTGLEGLAQMVPGGKYALDVAKAVAEKMRAKSREEAAKEVAELACSSTQTAQKAVADVMESMPSV